MITFFKSLYDTRQPEYITIQQALSRIENGASLKLVHEIRGIMDKEKRDAVKCNLPSVCFSGKFTERKESALVEHSGFMIIDFDDVGLDFRAEIEKCDYTYACWLSPSGRGFKMLIRIHDPKYHREHFASFQKNVFPNADSSGKDPSRVCFESYDPEIYINENSKVYTGILKETYNTQAKYDVKVTSVHDGFNNLLKWLTNKGGAFASGQRNDFLFRLASACCRFGIHEQDAFSLIEREVLINDSTFTRREAERTIKSAYKANGNNFGTASFDSSYRLVTTTSSLEIDLSEIEGNSQVRDVIYSDDVKEDALRILMRGYEVADNTGVDGIDFKFRKGDLTLLSGIGNYGKSTFLDYLLLTKSIKDGDKWGIFTPETFPPEEFYHDKVEMIKGRALNGHINHEMSNEEYLKAYDWIGRHFFYCYPKDEAHTPEYILERFLELIIKEKIKGVVIDPFNQMSNDYKADGHRDDKYLERTLAMFSRFAKENGIYFIIVAHPKMVKKGTDGKNYECPNVFDIAGGAMWNNKMDNIIVYHRPLAQSEPQSPEAEFNKLKIRRQKSVGKKEMVMMSFDYNRRRFFIGGVDYMQKVIDEKKGVNITQTEVNNDGYYKNPPF